MKKQKENIIDEKTQGDSQSIRRVTKTIGLVISVVVFGAITLFAAFIVMASVSAHRESVAEAEFLRDVAHVVEGGTVDTTGSLSALEAEMLAINPDYVGWLKIEGTEIDYPVVRGADNYSYLTTSFQGQHNPNGSIFMDFRNISNVSTLPHIIIYGHNTQQGGKFTDLHRFLNSDFKGENNTISLQIGNETLEFTIFAARLTDITDPAYFLDFSIARSFARFADRIEAPLRAMQIITLSTCTNDSNNNARLVVQGYR